MFLLRTIFLTAFSSLVAPIVTAGPVEDMIKFVTVGDPRNPDEDDAGQDNQNSGIGYVGQEFQMAETEVTNEMYARFLNAVAKDDRLYGLYTTRMATETSGGILRSGSNGSYAYTVKAGFEQRPVNFVTAFDAMRFINWLHNGMPVGAQRAATTEDGAYSLLGANPIDPNSGAAVIRRNAGAKYFLPDQDEWHKAAYYDPNPGDGRPSESYWPFADQSLAGPGGNFTGSPVVVKTSSGASHYGTYDQDGNVAEWTDSNIAAGGGLIAGLKPSPFRFLQREYGKVAASTELANVGFRVAKPAASTPPAPGQPLVRPVLVRVDNEFNPAEAITPVVGPTRLVGAVDYVFQMGAFEVTNEEYAKFLNAVAKDDSLYGLYDQRMQTDPQGGILRSGAPGSFLYSAVPGREFWPVNFVGIYDAMRFCNWLHNGAVAGADTEAGAYRLLGNIPSSTDSIARNPAARYFLPDDDEWHKAAFYDPQPAGKPSASYWKYAVRTDQADIGRINYAKIYGGLSDVLFPGFASFFGTYGQSGNAAELTESRESRGGSWESGFEAVSSSGVETAVGAPAPDPSATLGFRVAAAADIASGPPRPSTPQPPQTEPLLKPALVPVGEPFNPGDDNNDALGDGRYFPNRGAVPYEFQMGSYEVSNAEYAIFLNAVAKSDPLRLYNSRMDLDPAGGIKRSGRSGSFVYAAKAGRERHPVNFVDLYSAMRFCNWLHNGAQDGGRTESGAYQIFDEQSQDKGLIGEDFSIRRSASARYFLPNDSEWHKAAFYDPLPTGKPAASYWRYATKSDVASPGQVNFGNESGGLVDVDRYAESASAFGTFSQSGNVAEWTESSYDRLFDPESEDDFFFERLVRGGSFKSGANGVSSLGEYYPNEVLDLFLPDSNFETPTLESASIGFRVAAAPGVESGTLPPGPPPPPKGTKEQTITFKELPANKRVGSFAFKISPKASSGLPVVCESSDSAVAIVSVGRRFTYVLVRGPGEATITAKQEGDTVWAPAEPVSRKLLIAPRASRPR